MTTEWTDKDYIAGNVRVTLEHIGEGWEGDYNPDDPEDQELVRFSVYQRDDAGEWEQVDDASYCTQIPITINDDQRDEMGSIILGSVRPTLFAGGSVKKICEWLSWINLDEINESLGYEETS